MVHEAVVEHAFAPDAVGPQGRVPRAWLPDGPDHKVFRALLCSGHVLLVENARLVDSRGDHALEEAAAGLWEVLEDPGAPVPQRPTTTTAGSTVDLHASVEPRNYGALVSAKHLSWLGDVEIERVIMIEGHRAPRFLRGGNPSDPLSHCNAARCRQRRPVSLLVRFL